MSKSTPNVRTPVSSPATPYAFRLNPQRGGASLNFVIAIAVIAAVVYSVMNYAPVAYKALEYKDEMQLKVDQAAAYGYTDEWVKDQLRTSAAAHELPPDAAITAARTNNQMEASVRYTRPISLPGFTYDYKFDHTVRSSAFFTR